MSSILFINRVHPPDAGATGQLLAELAEALVKTGWRVTVVTSRGATGLPRSETVAGVRVERVAALPFTRASHWRRALSYLSLYPALLWRALQLPRAEVVVTLTDPPLLLVLGVVLKALKGSLHVHWAQDIYPELAEEMDVLPKDGMVARALRWISTAGFRHADRLIAVGRCMKARLVQRGLPPSAIEVIPNWGRSSNEPEATTHASSQFRAKHGLRDRFVIMYSGNLGLAHPFDAILDAAARLHSTHPDILFLIVGVGPRLAQVKQQVDSRSLGNVRFLPPQPPAELAGSLGAADLHLASMLENLCGLVVPSKVYGILAAGRPCVFLGPKACEAAQLLEEFRCGSVTDPGDGEALALCIVEWVMNGERLRDAGQRAEQAARNFCLSAAVSAFHEILLQVASAGSSRTCLTERDGPACEFPRRPAAAPRTHPFSSD